MRRFAPTFALVVGVGCTHVDVTVSTSVGDDGIVTRHVEAKHSNEREAAATGGLLDVLVRPTGDFARVRLTPARYDVDGRFARDTAIPCDILWQPDADKLQPCFRFRNSVTVDSHDLVLIRTHRYREALSGAVVAPEFDLAVKRFFAAASDLVMRVAEEVYGDEFDVEELRRFLDYDAAPHALQLAIELYDFLAAHKPSQFVGGEDAWGQRVIGLVTERARRLGLDVDFREDDDAQRVAFADWFDSRVTPLFLPRRLDARPLTFARIEADAGRLSDVVERILAARYDTTNDLEWRIALEFFPPGLAALVTAEVKLSFRFAGQAVLPGEVFRTNGIPVTAGCVSFEFKSAEIFPEGYEMVAESFVPDVRAQERLLGRALIADRKRATAFVDEIERMDARTLAAVLHALRTAPEAGAIAALGALESEPRLDRRRISSLRGWLESLH